MCQKASIEILNYWDRIRGQFDAPLRAQIDPASVRHILPHLFILEEMPSGTSRFRLAGTAICNLFGRELRERSFASLWAGDQSDDPVRIARSVMAHAVPALMNATGYTVSGRQLAVELAMMPIRSSSETCDRLLGCLTPVANSTSLGAEPVEFLSLDRSRMLTDRSTLQTEEPEEQQASNALLVSTGSDFGGTMRRMLHLKIFEGGRT
ncbi:PAS domain-containing protein [Rhizobium tubonense]|uniref:PAS domain-containing protein n=1 Tax=Rhizobium tubonense TaxID=484088 RepID=A0A2W4CC05_9HYPH|nr:PAS domain-containing protein [Rhizobium tubonense]PZM10779.1 PAS domain-containing protein [Rhizobium tubonense]